MLYPNSYLDLDVLAAEGHLHLVRDGHWLLANPAELGIYGEATLPTLLLLLLLRGVAEGHTCMRGKLQHHG